MNHEEAINSFQFRNALLKSVKDYGTTIKGIVQSRQTYTTPDGQLKSRFIASRQITIITSEHPKIAETLRPLLAESDEFVVNLAGYLTTTVREKDGKSTWYDNQMVTELEVLA